MPSGKNSKNSMTNLMQLFKVQPNNQVVTRQDLMRDCTSMTSAISLNSENNDDNENDGDSDDDDIIAINNYYTWNSSVTNASIHKERKAIMSSLQSAESVQIPSSSSSASLPPPQSSSLPPPSSSWPMTSKSFTRSPRVQDIVAMCTDERNLFSADEYHNNETVHAEYRTPAARRGTRLSPPAASTAYGGIDSGHAEPGGRNGRNVAATSRRAPEPAAPAPRPSYVWQWMFGLFGKK